MRVPESKSFYFAPESKGIAVGAPGNRRPYRDPEPATTKENKWRADTSSARLLG